MAKISTRTVRGFMLAGTNAGTTTGRGRALEDLICYVFERIPGISVTTRDALNAFRTEEIDIAFWNNRDSRGLHFLSHIILVECKNWSSPVGSEQVAYFDRKVRDRGLPFGVLVAANGITGNAHDRTQAQSILASALVDRRQIVVITLEEIQTFRDTSQIVSSFKEKLCALVVSGGLSSPVR